MNKGHWRLVEDIPRAFWSFKLLDLFYCFSGTSLNYSLFKFVVSNRVSDLVTGSFLPPVLEVSGVPYADFFGRT